MAMDDGGSRPRRPASRSSATSTSSAPCLTARSGPSPTVLVSSAAAAEEVMKTRDLAFAMAERLFYGRRDVGFAPYGNYWPQARRIFATHLLSARRVAAFRRVREQEAAALAGRVRRAASSLSDLLIEYANNVVSRAAFGDASARGLYLIDGEKGRKLRKVFTNFVELLNTAPSAGEVVPWLGWLDAVRGLEGKVRKTSETLDGVLEKVIDDHRRWHRAGQKMGVDDHCRDFVDVLLDVSETDEEFGIQLGTTEIKAIIRLPNIRLPIYLP